MIKKQNILFAFFIIAYTISCLTISSNQFGGFFSYTTTLNLIVKFIFIFVLVFIATAINKCNEKKVVNYTAVALNAILCLYLFDYYFTNISGSEMYYRMWWLSAIFIAQGAYFIAAKIAGYKNFAKKFWISFLPTYLCSFIIIFLRKPFTYFSVNLKLGNGVLSTADYLISHISGNTWPLFNLVGNIIFFIPIPFFIKILFHNLKNYQIFLISAVLPYFIEGYQYIFRCGDVDIDDILLNTTGLIIGFIIYLADNIIENKTIKA